MLRVTRLGHGEPTPTRSPWRAVPWGLAAVALLFAGWTLWDRSRLDPSMLGATHFDIGFPPDVEPLPGLGAAPSSPSR
jgi:hypothetical protein